MDKIADGGVRTSHQGTSNPVKGSSLGSVDDQRGQIGKLDLREEAAESRREVQIERGDTVLDHVEPFQFSYTAALL
jgi:hypothetical protein